MRPTIPFIAARITISVALVVTVAQGMTAQLPGEWIKAMAPVGAQSSEAIDLDTRMLRFWDAAGAPIAVVQYSLTLHGFTAATGPVDTVAMGLRLTSDRSEAKDSSWTQATGPSADHAGDRFARGFAIVALGPGATSWYLTLASTGSLAPRQGGVAAELPLPTGSIVVSDLALASDESFDGWDCRGEELRLSRTNLFDRKHPIHVAYQVKSDSSRDVVKTWITVTNVSDSATGKRLPQINFLGTLHAGISCEAHDIDLSKQKPGKYLLELQVGGMHGGGASVRMTTFTLK